MLNSTVCQNCSRPAAWKPIFAPTNHLVQCTVCGGWSFTGPVDQSPDEIYDESYFNGGEYAGYAVAQSSHALNFRRKLNLLSRHIGTEPIKLLEVGCATGEFLEAARVTGISKTLGIEPSRYCRQVARTRGFEVLWPLDAAAQRAVRELEPNVIVAWDVWEHLLRPSEMIDHLIGLAGDRVAIALTTVDSGALVPRFRGTKWRQFHPPTHLHYPTRRSFVEFFSRRGFQIVHHRAFGSYRPMAEYVRALNPRWGSQGSGATKVLSVPVYLNLFDTQLVIARRGGAQ